ncbi:hypothetical protein L1987_78550 [Smallanthus sonchifolius]|uniref:Uncharacterized protein n=1 Tax=Smallanthus sonchifolius TaxID=185202 RepID=A0ACB8ZE20_9ASTR|nr:hypothetical protein L1987_78550 [Smallanthus sonchifolius]
MYLQLPPNPQYTLAFIRFPSPTLTALCPFPLIRYVAFYSIYAAVSPSLLLHLRRRVPQPSTPLTPPCPPAFYSLTPPTPFPLLRSRPPCHLPRKLLSKGEWHLENDGPKDLVFIKAKKIATNWRSKLVTKYVNAGTTPFAKYKYLEREHWDAFVAEKTSPAFVVYVN